jgi:hypothetical protein
MGMCMCVFVVLGALMSSRFALIQCLFLVVRILATNLDSDPEEFARTICEDLNITDPKVKVCLK